MKKYGILERPITENMGGTSGVLVEDENENPTN
jgi:hypothetical protein